MAEQAQHHRCIKVPLCGWAAAKIRQQAELLLKKEGFYDTLKSCCYAEI